MLEKIKSFLKNDTVERVYKTFLQAFLATLAVSLSTTTDFTNMEIVKSILIGAIAAGVSAVMNLVINNIKKESE